MTSMKAPPSVRRPSPLETSFAKAMRKATGATPRVSTLSAAIAAALFSGGELLAASAVFNGDDPTTGAILQKQQQGRP